jgi:hypothetical protein
LQGDGEDFTAPAAFVNPVAAVLMTLTMTSTAGRRSWTKESIDG